MNTFNGWVREKLHQSVNKLIVVRNMAAVNDTKPRFRVVFNYYYGHAETEVTLKCGDDEHTFVLPLDNELYRRSETQVYVVDFDTSTFLSFSQAYVLGISPKELAQAVKVKQVKQLLKEKPKSDSNTMAIIAVILSGVVCLTLGVFVGLYLATSGAPLVPVNPNPTLPPIMVLP